MGRADIQRLAELARPALLARIRKRLSGPLRRAVDAEDVYHDSLAVAVRARGTAWRDTDAGFERYVMSIAELRIRHEARSLRVRETFPLEDGDPDPRGARAPDPRPSPALRLRPQHRWVVFLRDWMDAPWETAGFLLERPSPGSVQGLHHRARETLHERLARRGD